MNYGTGIPNSAATPVAHGGFITLYATGAGQLTPSQPDGTPDQANFAHPLLPVTATIPAAFQPT